MRLKQLAVALLCSGAFIAPALAQQPMTSPTMPSTTTTVPRAPTMAPGTPTGKATTPTTTTSATGGTPAPTSMKPMTPAATMAPATTAPATTAAMPQGAMTNINTASAADLDKLPQIGKSRAAKIIGGRPYKTTDELLSRKILPKNAFDKIKDKITVS